MDARRLSARERRRAPSDVARRDAHAPRRVGSHRGSSHFAAASVPRRARHRATSRRGSPRRVQRSGASSSSRERLRFAGRGASAARRRRRAPAEKRVALERETPLPLTKERRPAEPESDKPEEEAASAGNPAKAPKHPRRQRGAREHDDEAETAPLIDRAASARAVVRGMHIELLAPTPLLRMLVPPREGTCWIPSSIAKETPTPRSTSRRSFPTCSTASSTSASSAHRARRIEAGCSLTAVFPARRRRSCAPRPACSASARVQRRSCSRTATSTTSARCTRSRTSGTCPCTRTSSSCRISRANRHIRLPIHSLAAGR